MVRGAHIVWRVVARCSASVTHQTQWVALMTKDHREHPRPFQDRPTLPPLPALVFICLAMTAGAALLADMLCRVL